MKIKAFASFLALFLLTLAAAQQANAQAAGGTYQFSLEDGYTKYLDFNAQTQPDGTATGSMMLSDEAPLYYQDVDGAGDPVGKYPGFYIKADFDQLVVKNNQAVMSGTVRDASIRELIGLRVLLTVEDNGDNTRIPDKLTWGVYKPIVRDWVPSDAEWKEDPGVGLRWWATDAEVRDDRGYAMPRSEAIDTNSFPVSSYAFVDVAKGAGDIVVRS
ncbi:MAG TPA: hypothetical protein VGB17_10790 [Pyrinomonadaceae bacterium]|jgi:hypothetical protein